MLVPLFQTVSALVLGLAAMFPHRRKRVWRFIVLCAVLVNIGAALVDAAERQAENDRMFEMLNECVMGRPAQASSRPPSASVGSVTIRRPQAASKVEARTAVEGEVQDRNATVWVVVHPLDVSAYWVQPSVSVHYDGTWSVIAYVGRPGSVDAGRKFEILAVANPKRALGEGQVLAEWPDAQWRSDIVEVVR